LSNRFTDLVSLTLKNSHGRTSPDPLIIESNLMKILEMSPILWTKSIVETIAFYEEVLGFKGQSNFPNFISFEKDDTRIMFVVPQEESEDYKDPGNKVVFFPKPVMTGSIYMFMEDVDGMWEQVKNKARIKSSVADREYLMRDFSILDNNGYELVFGHDISRSGINSV
jgi:catechol 2,3-dioxygenase-like lactoylglutathione lyase family enzyme